MDLVAVTGLGLVSALGGTLAQSWPRLVAGEHGFAPISRFDASAYAARVAAEVGGFDSPGPPEWRRGTRVFLEAARQAWCDAGLVAPVGAADGAPPPGRRRRGGVFAGTSVNYLHLGDLRELWRCRDESGSRVEVAAAAEAACLSPGAFGRRHGETVASAIADALALEGPRVAVDTACASGGHAIADAFRAVARGEVPVAVAGGGAALVTPLTLLAFSRIGALSTNPDPATASRPFDKARDGFVLGEGAAVVVLESLPAARARGARVYALVSGAATTVNAGSLTDPSPGGEVEAETISCALADARLRPADIDFVAAHGTSTPRNDATETLALHRALGAEARRVAVSSHKGQLGHTLPAAGAINVVLAALAIHHSVVPPTAHLQTPDPECDLDYVPGRGRAQEVRGALAHAFAFGGLNAVIVLRRHERPSLSA